MSSIYGLQCTNCHGGMEQVKENPNPWLHEPRCDTCHDEPGYGQDQALYRHSKGHGKYIAKAATTARMQSLPAHSRAMRSSSSICKAILACWMSAPSAT